MPTCDPHLIATGMPAALRAVARRISAYGDHPDRRTALANSVALLVASSQPFFPLYMWWTVGPTIWPGAVTLLSTPFFVAVPAMSRRSSAGGRALLVVVGIANTVICAKAFGVQSGVEVFLIPCIALALLLFRPDPERWVALGLAGLAFAAYFGLHGRYGAPFHAYAAAEYDAFVRLNFSSAAGLTAFVAFRFARLLAEMETSAGRGRTTDGSA